MEIGYAPLKNIYHIYSVEYLFNNPDCLEKFKHRPYSLDFEYEDEVNGWVEPDGSVTSGSTSDSE